MTHVLINGEIIDKISVFDRGIHYGDGLFETMLFQNGKIQLWDEHWERLTHGCKQLSLTVPNRDKIAQEITKLTKNVEKKTNHVIKLIVTRGEGQRGYKYEDNQEVTRILICYPMSKYPETYTTDGVTVRYCETRLSENKKLAGIKHLNRLEQILARNEWDTDEFQEGLMLTDKGYVTDGTMSNIFAVKDNMIFTPDLSLCGVAGVMRKKIINLSKGLGLSAYEKKFTKGELEDADELFLTNSLFGIWPVKIIAKTRFTKVGNITKQLQNELNSIR